MTNIDKPQRVGDLRAEAGGRQSDRAALNLAMCGVAGPLLFIGVFTVLGALRPGYSAVRQAVSDLGLGPNARLLNGSGLVCAALMIVAVAAFFRRLRGEVPTLLRWIAAVLLALPPIGLAVAGIFTEARATVRIHWLVGGTLLFRGPAVAFLFTALALLSSSRWRGWSLAALIAGLGDIATWIIFGRHSPLASAQTMGLAERIIVIWILGWYVLGSWRLARDKTQAE